MLHQQTIDKHETIVDGEVYKVYRMWWGIDYSANVVPPSNATMFNDTLHQASWDHFQSPLCTIFRHSAKKRKRGRLLSLLIFCHFSWNI